MEASNGPTKPNEFRLVLSPDTKAGWRARQALRFRSLRGIRSNAAAAGGWLDRHTPVEAEARELLASASERLGLSARGYHRVLKVARTIADIDGDEPVRERHIAEALRYRPATVPASAGAVGRGAARPRAG